MLDLCFLVNAEPPLDFCFRITMFICINTSSSYTAQR